MASVVKAAWAVFASRSAPAMIITPFMSIPAARKRRPPGASSGRARRFLAFRTDPKNFEGVADLRVTELAGDAFEGFRDTALEHLHASATATDDMMMMFGVIELVAIGAITEVAPPN